MGKEEICNMQIGNTSNGKIRYGGRVDIIFDLDNGVEMMTNTHKGKWSNIFQSIWEKEHKNKIYFNNVVLNLPHSIIWGNTTAEDVKKYQLDILEGIVERANNEIIENGKKK